MEFMSTCHQALPLGQVALNSIKHSLQCISLHKFDFAGINFQLIPPISKTQFSNYSSINPLGNTSQYFVCIMTLVREMQPLQIGY